MLRQWGLSKALLPASRLRLRWQTGPKAIHSLQLRAIAAGVCIPCSLQSWITTIPFVLQWHVEIAVSICHFFLYRFRLSRKPLLQQAQYFLVIHAGDYGSSARLGIIGATSMLQTTYQGLATELSISDTMRSSAKSQVNDLLDAMPFYPHRSRFLLTHRELGWLRYCCLMLLATLSVAGNRDGEPSRHHRRGHEARCYRKMLVSMKFRPHRDAALPTEPSTDWRRSK